MSEKTQLPLHVGELLIRRVGPDDLNDLCQYWSDPDVARYQFWGPHDVEQVAETLSAQSEIEPGDPGIALILAVELEGKVIGDCQVTITSVDDQQAEIGFMLNPHFKGRGFATQAVTAVLGFTFNELGIHRVIACTDVRNERSWRLMERIGMRREAHFLHDCLDRGEWADDFVYAMLDHEWRQRYEDRTAEAVNALALDEEVEAH